VPIAKRELLWAGSAGLACWLAGVIFIDRKRTGDAISVMSEVAQTLLTQDVRVWVFPEGTRNHNGSMLPFKCGAFHLAVQAQVPIVHIVMSSYQDFYCKKERRFTSGECSEEVWGMGSGQNGHGRRAGGHPWEAGGSFSARTLRHPCDHLV
jgi:lysophosphatidate acyltransferase